MTKTEDGPFYELRADKKAVTAHGTDYVLDEARFNKLPKVPENFHKFIGTYAAVSKEATRRNNFQIKSGFIDYLYSPDFYEHSKELAA